VSLVCVAQACSKLRIVGSRVAPQTEPAAGGAIPASTREVSRLRRCDFAHFTSQGFGQKVASTAKGIAMHLTIPGTNSLQTIFGSGYIQEQRGDESRRNLPPPESVRIDLDFSEILKALRSALGLR
jgi:hypothetical protein